MPRVKREVEATAAIEQAEEAKTMDVIYDSESETVTFPLNGIEVTLRSPRGRDFLLMESWIRQAQGDYRDSQIALIKLASLCVIKFGNRDKVTFDELFSRLEEIEDVERVAAAISFFRDRLESYFKRYVSTDS